MITPPNPADSHPTDSRRAELVEVAVGGVGYMSVVGDYRRGWLLSIARDGSVAVLVQQVTGWVALASLRRL